MKRIINSRIIILVLMLFVVSCTQVDEYKPPVVNPPTTEDPDPDPKPDPEPEPDPDPDPNPNPDPEPDPDPTPNPNKLRAIVVNEGQFGYGTASITTLTHGKAVEQDVFRRINNRPLGDVAQSMTRIGNRYYVPLNNSKKVEVFEVGSYKSVETMTIDLDVIPMYVQHLGGDSIAVTDQKNNSKLMIMDIAHGTNRKFVRRFIDLGVRSFQMCLTDNKLFVGGDRMMVFDLNNLTKSGMRHIQNKHGDGFALCDFSKIVKDNRGFIWVLNPNCLYCIDPVTEKTVEEIDLSGFNVNSWTGCIDVSPDGGTIYFNVSRNVYSVDILSPTRPSKPIISPNINDERTVYNMAVSKENTVFMCDVLYGSLSRALIYEYNPSNGELLQQFKAGIFPHYVYFE